MIRIDKKPLIIALAITLVVIGGLLYYLETKALNIAPLRTVIVAQTNILENTIITEEHLIEAKIPEKFIVPGSFNNKGNLIGKIARENIYPGEQILNQKLIQGKGRDGLSAVIKDGYRAITINVNPVSGVGGHIREGDFIDILVFLTPPYSEKESIKTVFQNVEILDVGGQGRELVTLSMNLEDCQKLYLIEQLGKIRLVLRKITDNKEVLIKDTNIESIR